MHADRRPVLFVSRPESGLLNPLLMLAGELARRGVPDLWFASDESRRGPVEALAAASPVEFSSLGSYAPELSVATADAETYERLVSRSKFRSHRTGIDVMYHPGKTAGHDRALMELVDELRPALIVADCTSAFAVGLAVSRDIPFVVSVPFLPSYKLAEVIPFLTRSHLPWDFPAPHTGLPYPMNALKQLRNQLFRLRHLGVFFGSEMRRRIAAGQELNREAGIRVAPDAAVTQAELMLCASVPEADFPFTPSATQRFTGAMLPPLPEAPEDTTISGWLDEHPSVVYIGLGTLVRLNRADVEALVETARRLGDRHQVLWKLPAGQQEYLPPPENRPANLRIETWLPSQLDVLAHPSVKVFLTHAGSNGFHESLYFGKPMVTAPRWMDCYDVAARGEQLGVSVTLDRPRAFEPADVAAKLTRVLTEDSFSQAAGRLGELQRAAGGTGAAADLLLALPALARPPAVAAAEGTGC